MLSRQTRIDRIVGVLEEWETATVAARLLLERSRLAIPDLVERIPGARPIRVFRDNLERTYFIRLFAEFEVGLREVWEHFYKRTSLPRARDLVEAIAALRNIPEIESRSVHAARLYRNAIVHEGDEAAVVVPIPLAKHHLCRFFSRLPLDW